ncbi:MAG: hypothetical protein AB1Z63_02845, partial [Candidatus Limnocylindrales bacterium]
MGCPRSHEIPDLLVHDRSTALVHDRSTSARDARPAHLADDALDMIRPHIRHLALTGTAVLALTV